MKKSFDENIKKYVKSFANHNIKNYRFGKCTLKGLIAIWIFALGSFAWVWVLFNHSIMLCNILAVLSILFAIISTFCFKKRDYRWYLYMAFNLACIDLGFIAMIIVSRTDSAGPDVIHRMCICYIVASVLAIIFEYYYLLREIKAVEYRTPEESYKKPSDSIIVTGGIASIVIIKFLPGSISSIIYMIMGAFLYVFIMQYVFIYFYSIKVDPNGEYIRNKENENQRS